MLWDFSCISERGVFCDDLDDGGGPPQQLGRRRPVAPQRSMDRSSLSQRTYFSNFKVIFIAAG